ncbi:MAG: hypothetical protein ABJB85_11390, partial [Nitrososphaerota archaeon]
RRSFGRLKKGLAYAKTGLPKKTKKFGWSYNSTEIRSILMILQQRCKKMKMQVNLVNSLWIYLPQVHA